jgi:hypothetical protein
MPRVSAEVKHVLRASRTLPQPVAGDQIDVEARGDRYGNQYVMNMTPTKHGLADEGSYFVLTNTTPGTGIAFFNEARSSYDAAKAIFMIKNDYQPGPTGKRMYFDYIRLIQASVLPAGTITTMNMSVHVDTVNRRSSGGQNLPNVPVNVNADDTVTQSQAKIWVPNNDVITVVAPTSTGRVVSRPHLATSQVVAGDEYIVQFGPGDMSGFQGLTAARATATARIIGHASPVIIGPQQYMYIFMWIGGMTSSAPTYEFELTWWER